MRPTPANSGKVRLGVYDSTETAAMVHTHSPAATAVSALVDEIPAVHYYVALFGGPVAVAPYATYGTDELAAHVAAALRGRTACLMANHGAVTIGPDLATAYRRATYLEWLCDVYLRAASTATPRCPARRNRACRPEARHLRPAPAP